MDPASDTLLTAGQRLMLALVIAPGALTMALGRLAGPLSDRLLTRSLSWIVFDWGYVLFMVLIACTAMWIAVVGRSPDR